MRNLKTAEEVQVGDVVRYRNFGGQDIEVKVDEVSSDIKNGRAGFGGWTVKDNIPVWGYCSQIVCFISHTQGESSNV